MKDKKSNDVSKKLGKRVREKEIVFETLNSFGIWGMIDGQENPRFTSTETFFNYLDSLPSEYLPSNDGLRKRKIHFYQMEDGRDVILTSDIRLNENREGLNQDDPFKYSLVLNVRLPYEKDIPKKLLEKIKEFGFFEFTKENYLEE